MLSSNRNRLVTYKDYMNSFECSATTARRMIAVDRKRLGIKRITAYQAGLLQ